MERLSRDELYLLAIELELPYLLNFCSTTKKFSELICSRDEIWRYKLKTEFPDYQQLNLAIPLKDIYILLYKLNILKEKLKRTEDVYKLYQLKTLHLGSKVRELPKEIGILINLQELYIESSRIETIPKEIGQLTNLKKLLLYNNSITTLPPEIGNLINLETLSLDNNQIESLPKEIGNLMNLRTLSVDHNPMKKLPREVELLLRLRTLHLNPTQQANLPKGIIQKIPELSLGRG